MDYFILVLKIIKNSLFSNQWIARQLKFRLYSLTQEHSESKLFCTFGLEDKAEVVDVKEDDFSMSTGLSTTGLPRLVFPGFFN